MNFEFNFFGIDQLFSISIDRAHAEADSATFQDWILVTLQSPKKSWLILQLDRSEWKDDTAALELANIIAARKLADCDGLALGTPQWIAESRKRQLGSWLDQCRESGEGRWANSRLPKFRWFLIHEGRNAGDQ